LLKELVHRWRELIRIIRREKIDRAVSISGITTSFPARICRIPNVTFTDTEDAKISNFVAFPFTDVIYTPEFFLQSLGRKHRRYSGLHELAYLQGYDFEEGKKARQALGLPARYSIIRRIAFDALHDEGVSGFSEEELLKLVAHLKAAGEVFITSQSPLPSSLSAYRLDTPLEKIHAVLEGAQVFIGESPTMAVESSLLGTPAFLVSNRSPRLGNMVHLERDYDLLRCFPDWHALKRALPGAGDLGTLKSDWSDRAQRFRAQCPDMASFIYRAVTGGNA
jgi:predicted glycosyltransferase